MQNFSNSPAAASPGFPSRGVNMVGSSYPPHLSDPQISPRMIEDYAAIQHHQPILQSHGQHLHLRGQQHPPVQMPHIHGYGPRRGAGEMPQAGAHGASSGNSYRKENMDYYLSLGGRDRNRRGGGGGGGGYGSGFGYANMDGHMPHQYRHISGSGPSSGMISPFPMDYSTSAASAGGSGVGSGGGGGGGSFSPSQQFAVTQNVPLQPQQSQKYLSHQGLHQGQRAYPLSGHRIASQFGQFPSLGAPAASPGMYNSPPLRYEAGGAGGGMDSKVNSSPTQSNPNPNPGSAAPHNSGHQENVGQGYPTTNHPAFSPQSHSVPKHASRRTPQHNPGAAYDASLKMQHPPPSQPHLKNNQSSLSSPHHASQDVSKSPMHSQNQQAHMNQNFSPISNPSPAPSAIHSPSCSSSSSPLMGVPEGLGNSSSLQPSLLNPRGSHGHTRPQQTLAQLSPTPSSNSSVSSCGSAASAAAKQSRARVQQERISQDPGLNSLNALTSQVANLPNTVQHMILTDTVLSQKKNRDLQQAVLNQQKTPNASAPAPAPAPAPALGASNEGDEEPEEARKGHVEQAESEKGKRSAGSGVESNQVNCYAEGSNQTKTPGQNRPVSHAKEPESQTSSSPSPAPSYAEPSRNPPLCPPAPSASSSFTSSPARTTQQNCSVEPDPSRSDEKAKRGTKGEKKVVKCEEASYQEVLGDGKNVQILTRVKVEDSGPNELDEGDNDARKNAPEYCSVKNLNTPEQSSAGVGVIVSARSDQSGEGSKPTEFGKLHFPDEKHSVSAYRSSANHNGDGAAGMDMYTAHYDVPSKNEFGQSMPSNHCYPGSFPYNSPEIPYNACMGPKSKARAVAGGAMGAARYQDYAQPQSNFASRKDMTILGAIGRSGPGVGLRGHDNSQLQQPYPSLLQEVLQGYHLDRRYGRPDQTSGVHQPQGVYQTKLSYRMPDSVRPHVVGQSAASGHPMGTGKVHTQNQGPDHEVVLRPSWDPEAPRLKEEKGTMNISPSHSGHLMSSDPSQKHINLADYTLPHRKPPSLASPPSAVQQLLLQESNQLSGNAEAVSQAQLHASLSSGRRSVICDVSPSRRTTPEKERGQFGASVSSVIQQPHSSSALNEQDGSKEDAKDKKEREQTSKVDPGGLGKQFVDGHNAAIPKQEPSKSMHAPVEIISDLQRHSVKKEGPEIPSYNSQLHMPSVPLSSPPRCKPYPKSVGPYVFGDVPEGSKVNAPHPSHNLFHSLSASNHTPSSANKLQTYPHHLPLQQPHGMGDRFDWSESAKRPNDVSINHNSVLTADQKCKIQSPMDVLPNQHHLARQQSYPGAQCDVKIWESYSDREGPGHQERRFAVPHKSVAKSLEGDVSRGIMEESTKKPNPPEVASTGSMGGNVVAPGVHQGPRPMKSGGSAETNPLMLRRRVRSFISPIPAKRQHHDSGHKAGSSYSPIAPLDSRHLNNADSGGVDTHGKISPGANSPPLGKTKILPPRKGRGLKLEAIVQKITPNKKASYSNSHVDDDYPDTSHYNSDVPDAEMGVPFASVLNREGGCLPYLDEPHSLDDLLPYRAEDSYSCDPQDVKHGGPGSTGGTLRKLPTDFDFGLGTAGSSGAGMAEGDKDEFTLLGPLPPPPPLPCPVQDSPPPSSSALSDIQQFTSTYQQLETRRGEQSAANLLRQKLQDTGMGFDNYPGGDFYGATPSHGQSPGHHLLSRTPQHEFSSSRAAADSRTPDSFVPKGYFPSGKKKGRPVGSVNKQKRAQVQAQSAGANLPAAPHTPPAAGAAAVAVAAAVMPQSASNSSPAEEAVIMTETPEQKPSSPLDLAAQSQPTKVEMEDEDSQPVADSKPVKPRQKKGKDNNDGPKGRQWRKRGGIASKGELDPPADDGGNVGVLPDARKNVFSPYIHVERKITEIGAVCTIINAEGGKSSGIDALSNNSLMREVERVPLKGVDEQNESVLQSGKSVPTSGYVISGPVVSETGQNGRLLCCLCQKWANYKNLGDLYGPFYPADYAARLPKNQPQVRQSLSNQGASNTGSSPFCASAEFTAPDTRLICDTRTAGHTTNPVSPAQSDTLPCLSVNLSTNAEVPELNWEPMPNAAPAPITLDPPELEKEMPERKQQKAAEELQQRPAHRKLTSHPRFKRRHRSGEGLPRTIPINSKASLPFQPPPPSLDSLGPLAQLAQLPVVPLDPMELWVHESCIVWTSGVYLVSGKLYGLQEALDGARETSCSHCEMAGSTLGCYSKGCTLRYHYLCALEAECCLNEDNFSMRCPKHKFPLNGRPAKPPAAQSDQPERG